MAKKRQTLTAEDRQIDQIVARYGGEVGMLIPMMQDLQAECGYLSADQLRRLAARMNLPLTRLYAVATFYSSFRLTPKGRHEVTLCVGTVCYLKGSGAISEAITKEFQVDAGGTTADGLFSFQAVNCVGACALAPVMIVNGKYHDGVSVGSAMDILRGLPAEGEGAERKAKS
jgi:NADH:ubiquinone oxidoreductase subunit E